MYLEQPLITQKYLYFYDIGKTIDHVPYSTICNH